MNDLISVIVPVYNIEGYLDKCIDSIVHQTYKNLEILLVNDGSTDTSGKKCDVWAEKDKRIKVIHALHAGVSSARNTGIDSATGEYISFVDGDDWIAPQMYETLYHNASKYMADISCCGIAQKKIDGKISTLADGALKFYNREQLIKGFFDDSLIKETMYGPCNKIIKKTLLKDIKFNPRFAIGEDLLFMFECLEVAENVVLDNKPMYQYIKRSGSATTSSFSEKRMHYISVVDKLMEKCKEKYLYAYCASIKWAYMHKLVIMRQLNHYASVKKQYQKEYTEYKNFLKENKNSAWHNMTIKRKIDYFLVLYLPWIYRILPI